MRRYRNGEHGQRHRGERPWPGLTPARPPTHVRPSLAPGPEEVSQDTAASGWRRTFQNALVFDTETFTDLGQSLLFGGYRFQRLSPSEGDGLPRYETAEEGMFYDDDLPGAGPAGLDVLRDVARSAAPDVVPGVSPTLHLRTLTALAGTDQSRLSKLTR